MTFSSQLDARQFLIDKITREASRTDAPLSDAEQRMLGVSVDEPQSVIGIPVEILNDADGTYEKKFSHLLKSAYDRDRKVADERQKYREAIRTLKDGDHYILILASDMIAQGRKLTDYLVYAVIVIAVVLMIAILQVWTRSK